MHAKSSMHPFKLSVVVYRLTVVLWLSLVIASDFVYKLLYCLYEGKLVALPKFAKFVALVFVFIKEFSKWSGSSTEAYSILSLKYSVLIASGWSATLTKKAIYPLVSSLCLIYRADD